MTAIFVTATGTDIGKTFVTAGLIRHYRPLMEARIAEYKQRHAAPSMPPSIPLAAE